MPAPAATRTRETLYLLVCSDAPGSEVPREREMLGHLRFIETNLDRIAVAGPRTDGRRPIDGSILVVRADSAEDARALLEGDPYYRAGVWSQIDVHPFRAVCGTFLGGTTW
jgi:uncharacterized protein YciI